MNSDPDYIVEIAGKGSGHYADEGEKATGKISPTVKKQLPYISVMFECCKVYQRIYCNQQGTAYEGRCPRCLRPIQIRIGDNGTSCRFFSAR